MKAAFLAVGSELLGTDRVDTNSLELAVELERFGVELVEKRVVGDDEVRIAEAVRRLAAEVDLLVVSGGLGPTADDVTREGVARALGRDLRVDESVVDRIRHRFESRGLAMPEINRRQAKVVDAAAVIPNRKGTAPGLRIETERATLFLLPGVPRELRAMIESSIVPWLEREGAAVALRTVVLRIACEHESALEERLVPLYQRFGREGITTLAGRGEIKIVVKRPDPEPPAALVRSLFGAQIFGEDDATLEGVVGALLAERGERVATAESCTGGLVAERLTRVPGSSRYLDGCVVAYSNGVKQRELGVSPETIARAGAVSPEVARAMAEGVRRRIGGDDAKATWGIGVTGIAGPGGGSDEKPVGTVEVAIVGPRGNHAKTLRLAGDREKIRQLTSQWVLELLRRMLLGEAPE